MSYERRRLTLDKNGLDCPLMVFFTAFEKILVLQQAYGVDGGTCDISNIYGFLYYIKNICIIITM